MTRDPRLLEYARRHRREPTLTESMIWSDLRNRQLGYKFRRQHPIGPYIVDFVCLSAKLIVELDGWTHDLKQYQLGDTIRQLWLESEGYRVLRFDDEEVLEDRDGVRERHSLPVPTPLGADVPPRVIDQDAAHRLDQVG